MSTRSHLTMGAVLAATLVVSACGFDPATIPVPGTRIQGPTYRVQAQFTDVLNLPAQAKVFANGAQIGTVAAVSIIDPVTTPTFVPGYAVVELRLRESVRLPATTRAELRQQTVLGDINVTLIPPPVATSPALADGASIPLTRTRAANQVEDTMAILATFINGGSIDRFQDLVRDLDSALPQQITDTERAARNIAVNADDLAANLDDVDVFLTGLTDVTTDAARSAPLAADILTDTEVRQLVDAVSSLINALGLFGRIAEISRALTWLAPALQGADDAARAVMPMLFTSRPFDLNAPSNLNLITALLRDKIIPWVRYGPAVNLRSVTVDDGANPQPSTQDQVDVVLQTLRMLGAVR
ncbi:MlaD family protein [Nocardia sp. NPDC003693]